MIHTAKTAKAAKHDIFFTEVTSYQSGLFSAQRSPKRPSKGCGLPEEFRAPRRRPGVEMMKPEKRRSKLFFGCENNGAAFTFWSRSQ